MDVFDIVLEELDCSVQVDNILSLLNEVLDTANEALAEEDYESFKDMLRSKIKEVL